MKKVLFALAAFVILAAWTTNKNQTVNGGTKFTFDLQGTSCDPNASGTATLILNQGQGTISYELTVSDLTSGAVTAAHIHEFPVRAGNIVVGLNAPTGGSSSGVITTLSKEQIKEIRQNPEEYYVNVHTSGCGGGAVMGTLSK